MRRPTAIICFRSHFGPRGGICQVAGSGNLISQNGWNSKCKELQIGPRGLTNFEKRGKKILDVDLRKRKTVLHISIAAKVGPYMVKRLRLVDQISFNPQIIQDSEAKSRGSRVEALAPRGPGNFDMQFLLLIRHLLYGELREYYTHLPLLNISSFRLLLLLE